MAYALAVATNSHSAAVADEVTTIGLPEVQLGILPGWGGCARLSAHTGIANALTLICSGKRCDAKKALRFGMVDLTAHPAEIDAVFNDTNRILKAPKVDTGRQGLCEIEVFVTEEARRAELWI